MGLKLSYFCQKIDKFRALRALPPDPRISPHYIFLATHLLKSIYIFIVFHIFFLLHICLLVYIWMLLCLLAFQHSALFMPLIMVKRYSKVGGTQLQNKSISGIQQEKGWEYLFYSIFFVMKYAALLHCILEPVKTNFYRDLAVPKPLKRFLLR